MLVPAGAGPVPMAWGGSVEDIAAGRAWRSAGADAMGAETRPRMAGALEPEVVDARALTAAS